MDDNTFDHKHHITEIDPVNLTAVCSLCGPVTIYVSCRRYTSYPKMEAAIPVDTYERNTKIIKDYIQKHKCKRCGVWGLGAPENFKFFELHLPLKQRVARLAHKTDSESLKVELSKREMYCKRCYSHIAREHKESISVPLVKPPTVIF